MVYEIIEVKGKLFQLKRKFHIDRINLEVEEGISTLKQYYHCDTMFKADGFLWLCNEVKETEYEKIED
tara:strand:- start:420 stop:623 length:204 start_codon:yes stop_codon:yes gene_type:complete